MRWSQCSRKQSPVATDSASAPRAPPKDGSQFHVLGISSQLGTWVVGDEAGRGEAGVTEKASWAVVQALPGVSPE